MVEWLLPARPAEPQCDDDGCKEQHEQKPMTAEDHEAETSDGQQHDGLKTDCPGRHDGEMG